VTRRSATSICRDRRFGRGAVSLYVRRLVAVLHRRVRGGAADLGATPQLRTSPIASEPDAVATHKSESGGCGMTVDVDEAIELCHWHTTRATDSYGAKLAGADQLVDHRPRQVEETGGLGRRDGENLRRKVRSITHTTYLHPCFSAVTGVQRESLCAKLRCVPPGYVW
jgi:hypothetical protein